MIAPLFICLLIICVLIEVFVKRRAVRIPLILALIIVIAVSLARIGMKVGEAQVRNSYSSYLSSLSSDLYSLSESGEYAPLKTKLGVFREKASEFMMSDGAIVDFLNSDLLIVEDKAVTQDGKASR